MGFGLTKLLPDILYALFWVALVLSFLRPKYTLLYLMIAIPFSMKRVQIEEYFLGKYFIEIAVGLLMTNVLFFSNRAQYETGRRLSPLHFVFIAFIIYTFISLIVGSMTLGNGFPFDMADLRFGKWVNHITIFLMFFLAYHIFDPDKDIYYVTGVVFLLVLAFAFRFRNEFVYVEHTHFMDKSRVEGLLSNLGPNEIGAFFASYSMVALGMLFRERKLWMKVGLFVVVAAGTYGVMYSYSRGAYLSFLAGIILLIWMNKKFLFVFLACAFLFWNQILPTSVVERIEMTAQKDGYGGPIQVEGSAESRFTFGAIGMQMFSESPIYGKGFLTFAVLSPAQMDSHNVYVKYLAETGLIGIFLFLLTIYYFAAVGYKLYKQNIDEKWKGVGSGFMGLVTVVVIGNMFGDRWTYMALSSNYAVLAGVIARKISLLHPTDAKPDEIR